MIKLSKLLQGYSETSAIVKDMDIPSITLDARQVTEGGLFFAVQGSNKHGLEYLSQAIENGVGLVIYEANEHAREWVKNVEVGVRLIPMTNLSQHVSEIAARFYGHPSTNLVVIAITGTNGKTTSAYLLAQLLESQKKDVGIIGTLGFGRLNAMSVANLTTPDAVNLQRILADFVSEGITHVVMEASSHALAQYRLDAVEVNVAAFTNFSQDHLDYHVSMQEYLQAKLRLFDFASLAAVVINTDQSVTKEIIKCLAPRVKALAYKANDLPSELCDLFGEYCLSAFDVECTSEGVTMSMKTNSDSYLVRTQLLGEFNVANLLLCLQVMQALDFELETMLPEIEALVPPPGRLQKVKMKKAPSVIVDYAHTPDALENALETLKALKHNELIAVFGCGGNRDKSKRPIMATVAERLADLVVITDDNPRSEKSNDIIKDVLKGIKDSQKVHVISNRAEAIEESIKKAKLDDIILIAGKGHEDYQIIGDQKIQFSDYEHAYAALQKWEAAA